MLQNVHEHVSPVDMPSIPDDIVADITDHLQSDKATLSACSVVSTSWSRHARRQLFRRVVVQSDGEGPEFRTLHDFLVKHPELSLFIKELELGWVPENMVRDNRTLISLHLVASILAQLPNLKKVTFRGLNFDDDHHPSTASPKQSDPFPLDSVTFFDVTSKPSVWDSLVSLFSSKELCIFMDQVPERSLSQGHRRQHSAQSLTVQRLQLAAMSGGVIQGTIASALASGCLRSLDVALLPRSVLGPIGSLVQRSSSTLLDLHLNLCALRGREGYRTLRWHPVSPFIS